jgi:hypothetical protein
VAEENLYQQFGTTRDEELIRIAYSEPDDSFEPEAIKAAKEELDRRNVTAEVIVETQQQAAEKRDQDRGLSNLGWIAFMLVGPVFLISLSLIVIFYALGYRQKGKDAFSAILASFFFYGLVSAVFAAFAFLGS